MSVGVTDIVFYKSATGSSDGGAKSATALVSAVKNALWPDVSDASRVAGGTRTKKWFMANEHATDALVLPVTYCSQSPTGVTEELGLGFDTSDDSDAAQGNMTAWGASAVVALISDGADTRSITIYGLNGSSVPTSEVVVLTGAVEVLSVATFSKVWGAKASATSGSRTVLIKQGTGGTTRGTIGTSKIACFLWVAATSRTNGIILPNLVASASYGFWDRQTWPAATAASRPTQEAITVEETA